MDNPPRYIVSVKDSTDVDMYEIGSTLEWCKIRCAQKAETFNGTYVVYKLVPVFEAYLEVNPKVITRDL